MSVIISKNYTFAALFLLGGLRKKWTKKNNPLKKDKKGKT